MLSVVIPAYNCSKTIKQCLNAVHASNYNNFEVIVVDDGSEDETVDIINNFSNTKVIQLTKNKGSANARNKGVGISKGEIIVFVDSDVIISKTTLSKIKHLFDTTNTSIVQTIYSKICHIQNFPSQYQNLFHYHNFNRMSSGYIQSASTYCCAIRKKDFIDFDTKYSATVEDGEWGIKLYQRDKKILFDKNIQVQHLADYTLLKILKRSFRISRDKIISIQGYRKQKSISLNTTHHNKTKMASILFSPIPVLFQIINRKFLYFVYKEKGLGFLLKTMLFDEINYMVFLVGILWGSIC